jgi:hypothetical protein
VPDYFAHAVLAEVMFERLPKDMKNKIPSHSLYLLGAQGGDLFYAYRANTGDTNLGKRLHAESAQTVFESLLGGNQSYLLGFATHYAADSALHPSVYAFEKGKHSPLTHFKFEADLGLYTARKFQIARHILPRECVLGATSAIYDTIKKYDPTVTLLGVERCLKRHFRYTQFLYRMKKLSYYYDYEYAALDGALEIALNRGRDCMESLLCGKVDKDLFGLEFLQK